jgi:hypothetical protein
MSLPPDLAHHKGMSGNIGFETSMLIKEEREGKKTPPASAYFWYQPLSMMLPM